MAALKGNPRLLKEYFRILSTLGMADFAWNEDDINKISVFLRFP